MKQASSFHRSRTQTTFDAFTKFRLEMEAEMDECVGYVQELQRQLDEAARHGDASAASSWLLTNEGIKKWRALLEQVGGL